jgi:hypothetical protein
MPDAPALNRTVKDSTDPLARALEQAIAGRPEPLHDLLVRGSHLPGPRVNSALADAFAQLCRSRGAPAEAVAVAMSRLSPDEAPGAGAREFLPVCGVLAIAQIAAADGNAKRRAALLAELHSRADDLRFRVRDAVAAGLSRVGGAAGDALVADVASWMDGYFHAAAVVRALAAEPWLGSLHDAASVTDRLNDAFVLLQDAPRAAARWPGHKALVEALDMNVPLIALRFGVPVFDMLARWAEAKDPLLRDIVAHATRAPKLAGRFGPETARVKRALEATEPPPRNPDHDVGPTRNRGGTRRRRR